MASPRARPTGTPRGDRTKAAILEAAMTVFARDGYHASSIASIADSVNLTLPGLLHHFRSKEELFLAVLEERERRDIEALDRTLEPGSPGYFRSLESLVERNAHQPAVVKLFTVLVGEAAVSTEHPGREHFAARYRRILDRTRQDLLALQEAGVLASDTDCELVARLVVAMMDGLQIQWLLDPSFDMQAAFRAFAGFVIESTFVSGDSPTSVRPSV